MHLNLWLTHSSIEWVVILKTLTLVKHNLTLGMGWPNPGHCHKQPITDASVDAHEVGYHMLYHFAKEKFDEKRTKPLYDAPPAKKRRPLEPHCYWTTVWLYYRLLSQIIRYSKYQIHSSPLLIQYCLWIIKELSLTTKKLWWVSCDTNECSSYLIHNRLNRYFISQFGLNTNCRLGRYSSSQNWWNKSNITYIVNFLHFLHFIINSYWYAFSPDFSLVMTISGDIAYRLYIWNVKTSLRHLLCEFGSMRHQVGT